MRQSLQKEIELLRERSLNAEKFEETKVKIEKKQSQKDEIELRLKSLLEKHNETFLSAFGEVTVGPWRWSHGEIVKDRISVEQVTKHRTNVVCDSLTQSLNRADKVIDSARRHYKKFASPKFREYDHFVQGDIRINDRDEYGKHEVLENVGNTEQRMTGFRLSRIVDGRERSITFSALFVLHPGQTVQVSARGYVHERHGHHHHLEFDEDITWGTGGSVVTRLYNAKGVEIASFEVISI
ncbi:hypothetical protein KIN20_036382 [Parelaphostrongylus tenuis]|uniref:LTD domain-containing protein n=1 Tax=Parelaphostrongylus tenuis TaxID=148309 RepID=A0AAD5WLL9_PARTN|nr:hypothetical protein KIN20_036382 [Parelaphostrongylus tenuis]